MVAKDYYGFCKENDDVQDNLASMHRFVFSEQAFLCGSFYMSLALLGCDAVSSLTLQLLKRNGPWLRLIVQTIVFVIPCARFGV